MRKLLFYVLILSFPAITLGQFTPEFLDIKTFTKGEKLKYVIYYGPITGGYASLKVSPALFNKEPALHCEMVAKTSGLADRLYKVKDIYAAFFLEESTLPLKSIRDIHEGNYKRYNEVVFDHEKNLVNSNRKGIKEVPDSIRDMVSTLFYIRKIDYSKLKHGDIIKITTYFDDEIFPFDMRYRGKEKIKTKLGEVECIKLVPFVEVGRVFKTEDDMTLWLSDDDNLIPVRVRFDMWVGSLKIDLIEYSGLTNGDLKFTD